jgi:hypothetical protein
MENFEKNNINNIKNEFNWTKFDQIIEDTVSKKINPIVNSIRECDFNINDSRFSNKKIDKISEDIIEKHFHSDKKDKFEELKESIDRKILKISIEQVAMEDLGGSLSVNEKLEDEYLDILEEEGIFYSMRFLKSNNIYNLNEYLEKMVNELNSKKILDNKKKGELFDHLKYRLGNYEMKIRA